MVDFTNLAASGVVGQEPSQTEAPSSQTARYLTGRCADAAGLAIPLLLHGWGCDHPLTPLESQNTQRNTQKSTPLSYERGKLGGGNVEAADTVGVGADRRAVDIAGVPGLEPRGVVWKL